MKLRTFKANDVEYERWRNAAAREGLSFSAWLRRCASERAQLEEALEKERDANSSA